MIMHYIGNTIIIFAFIFIIAFFVLLFVVKFGSKYIMKFLGADIFTFDLRKRLKIITIISAVIAFIMAIGFWFLF